MSPEVVKPKKSLGQTNLLAGNAQGTTRHPSRLQCRGGKQEKERKGRKGRERYGDYDGDDHECACVFTCAHGGRVSKILLAISGYLAFTRSETGSTGQT